ncbi:MAG TPA: proton-conducting transporter membrane subunit [Opitutaceae bacterium]
MTANAAVLPVLLPLLTALVTLLLGPASRLRRWVAAVSAAIQVGVSIGFVAEAYASPPLVLALGGWLAPYGIVLVIDMLAAIMLGLGAATACATLLYGFAELPVDEEHPLRLPLVQFLMTGINLSFCTGDLFNLFVAFEVMLIASYALLTLEADDWDIKQAFPYLALNVVASTFFLAAAGLAYGIFGSLNFAQIAARSTAMEGDPRVSALALLLMVVFGLKAGVFPLYFWLPNSYPILPSPVGALYAGMLTKVGVYVLLRVFGQVLPPGLGVVHTSLLWLAAATMIFGVLGAVSRNFIRGILSWHILSQIGYMVVAIGLFTEYALAASIFYVIHHIIVKSTLFMVGGTAVVLNGSDDLDRTGRLWAATPLLGLVFLFQALSLAGLPPLSGFWGKYMIISEGVRQREWVVVACALAAGVLTLFSMLKIWNSTFWNTDSTVELNIKDRRWKPMVLVAGGMVAVSLSIGLGANFFLQLAFHAAHQLTDRAAYIDFMIGPGGTGASP